MRKFLKGYVEFWKAYIGNPVHTVIMLAVPTIFVVLWIKAIGAALGFLGAYILIDMVIHYLFVF